ncbi:hypothetical protein ACRQ4B_06190 [Curtobacterium sp. SP.BCo]|uniref:hypothetical protein n=1 Tax=Curtobacterium sp. SP.BCo TaxID=3435229 RepID=UPI003F73CED5
MTAIIGFMWMARSDGRLDRLVAFLVVFIGFALVVFATARPGQAALTRYWNEEEKQEQRPMSLPYGR